MPNANTQVRGQYYVATVILAVVALPLGWWVYRTTPIGLEAVEGITAFAILYVLAQAIERINQILVPLVDRLLAVVSSQPTASVKKQNGLLALRAQEATLRLASTGMLAAISTTAQDAAADGTLASNQADAGSDADKTVTTANIEKALLTNAFAFLLAIVAVSYFKFFLLTSIGFTQVAEPVEVLVTATAIMGGSAGLGDLISKIQKSKTADETKPA